MVQRGAITRAALGFTLVELLLVVILLALLFAIVWGYGATSTQDARLAALDATLRSMRVAIDLYHLDHGEYPSALGDGTHPAGSAEAFVAQLILYTDGDGDAQASPDATHRYGPYLKRGSVAPDPFLGKSDVVVVGLGLRPLLADAGPMGGWKFDNVSGQLIMNHPSYDDR